MTDKNPTDATPVFHRARINEAKGITKESLNEETIRIAAEILMSLNDKGYNMGHVYAALGRARKMIGLCTYLCPNNMVNLCAKETNYDK